MSAAVLTGWCGTTFASIACHTLPRIEQYAVRHGMSFCFKNLEGDRPASWQKVPMISKALEQFDVVVWIDADVVVMDPSENIADQLRPGTWQGLVEHDTTFGKVPNCGVWVCTRAMLPTLADIWADGRYVHHGWWEQAAVIERMGYVVTDQPHATLDTPTTLYEHTTFLPATWNHHPYDARRIHDPKFVHVTQYANRLAVCEQLARLAANSEKWKQT